MTWQGCENCSLFRITGSETVTQSGGRGKEVESYEYTTTYGIRTCSAKSEERKTIQIPRDGERIKRGRGPKARLITYEMTGGRRCQVPDEFEERTP